MRSCCAALALTALLLAGCGTSSTTSPAAEWRQAQRWAQHYLEGETHLLGPAEYSLREYQLAQARYEQLEARQ